MSNEALKSCPFCGNRAIILWCRGQIEYLKQFKDWEENEHICGRISGFEDLIAA